MNGTKYNLDKVVSIHHLKGETKWRYWLATETIPERGQFAKAMMGSVAQTKGCYYKKYWSDTDRTKIPVPKEKATYNGDFVKIRFVTDKYEGQEWEMKDEAAALNLIKLVENNKVCKYEPS